MIAYLLPYQGWQLYLAAALSGAAAALGLAPFDWFFLGLLGFVLGIALVAWALPMARAAWAFGFGYFAVALHWIVEPFFVDIARHGWMAPFALVFMAGGMALFWLAAGWLVRAIGIKDGAKGGAFALALVLVEGLRAYVLSGFPWAHPGHILIDTPALALAGVAGPHGLNLVVLGVAAGIAAILNHQRLATGAYLTAVAAVALIPSPSPAPLAEDAPQVRLVQPNAPQHLKWQPDMIPVFFDRGLELSAGPPVDLVVWPETAVPTLLEDSDRLRAEIAAAANAPVIFGVQRYPDRHARNALALMDASGDLTAVYDKHRLVPFGEYMPIRWLAARAGIDGLAAVAGGGYWPGDGPQVIEIGGGLGAAFVMICYEAIFPQYLRQVARPDWQLHLTNDAWFGSFSGPYQHLALARLRAAEAGLPVLRAANTGISAVIDARGQVVDYLPLNTAGALDVRLPAARPPTLYARSGDAPVLVLTFLLFSGLWLVVRKTRVDPGSDKP